MTKVQKLLFLIEQESRFFENYEQEVSFNFAPYKMGPFSENVYEELQFLMQLDAIEAEDISNPTGMDALKADLTNKKFEITPKGEKIASQLVEILEPEHRNELEDMIQEYNKMTLQDLLRYVYQEYPDFATESKIKQDLFAEGD
ncbi:type II toxin-antitoxin system antitoxin SocA domain-containing protein [Natrononativus amylolyticus]|uniref:type II toxin-antitoxin system antitoxin SocA domain-containing protein n=1 Tax=Natrononativus amylolyticus TaxID=2963434 RepID=UPI0020CB749B|nr:type II toxin-antitoxin system antitoxin SocA domain-containing protein [Natrononativus amylolyticus]